MSDATSPSLQVASSPHVSEVALTTQRMMRDVLMGLAPAIAVTLYLFQWYAVAVIGISTLSCLLTEAISQRLRGKAITLSDYSAAITGVILGLSLPWSAPWYIPLIGGVMAIGLGKQVFGGLGMNLFNPAMVGRAFVMLSFASALGAGAYVADGGLAIVSQATPLTVAKQSATAAGLPAIWPMFLGTTNGSLGETSALALLLGGIYLCLRRSASWEIPAGVLAGVLVLGGVATLLGLTPMNPLHQVLGGSLLFGAFFIATDPCSSPLAPKGKFAFGCGVGALVILLRTFSSYPEGLMFAILLMNATVPLINRWSIPIPVGGPVPERKPS